MIKLSLFISVVFSLMCFAEEESYSLSLNFELSEKLLKSHSISEVEQGLIEKVSEAEACINTAFKAAGSEIEVEIDIKSVSWLDEREESLKGYHPFEPDRNEKGDIIQGTLGGCANEHNVSAYETSVNHVTNVFNEDVMAIFNHPDMKPVLEAENIAREIEKKVRKIQETMDPMDPVDILDDKDAQIERLYAIEDQAYAKSTEALRKMMAAGKVDFYALPLSNRVRLMLGELSPHNHAGDNVLAHELMHSFGGLQDNYIHEQNTEPNLMGSHGGGNECVLTAEQVKSFKKYRKIR